MLLLFTGCVSLGDKAATTPTASKSSASVDPNDQKAERRPGGGGLVNSEIALTSPGPAPEVKRHNADAFAQAVAAMQADRMREAEILLLEVTADQPELAGPWINLGQVYVQLDQLEEARRAFENAVRANPWNCTAHNELGVLSRRYGDFDGAEKHYLACIERVPGFKDAYLNLGILYELYLGRLPEALEYYQHYQTLLVEPDRRVQGWVMDLQRRLGS